MEGAYGGRIPFGVALTNAICQPYAVVLRELGDARPQDDDLALLGGTDCL